MKKYIFGKCKNAQLVIKQLKKGQNGYRTICSTLKQGSNIVRASNDGSKGNCRYLRPYLLDKSANLDRRCARLVSTSGAAGMFELDVVVVVRV